MNETAPQSETRRGRRPIGAVALTPAQRAAAYRARRRDQLDRILAVYEPAIDVQRSRMRGSERQRDWASDIRATAIAATKAALEALTSRVAHETKSITGRLAKAIIRHQSDTGATFTADQLALALQRMAQNGSARWWIDHRHLTNAKLIDLALDEVAAGPIGDVVDLANARIRAGEVARCILLPEDHNGVTVEMILAGGFIRLTTNNFSEDFNRFVKSRSFGWKKPFWERDLGETASSAYVQLAVELMNHDYGVLIFDDTLRRRVLEDDYEAVSLSSVQAAICKKHGMKFRVRIASDVEHRGRIVDLLCSLKGAKQFKGAIYVPADQHVALVELAEMYDINLDPSAKEVIAIGEAIDEKRLLSVSKPKRRSAPGKVRETVAPQATIKSELADDD
jgi:hypothetical protein